MKKRCYPKSLFILSLSISIVSAMVFALSLGLTYNDKSAFSITRNVILALQAVVFFILAIQYMQYFYFDKDEIIIKSLFGSIVRLKLDNAIGYVEWLPTYRKRLGKYRYGYRYWICIYDKSIADNTQYKFKFGFSNSSKYKRIQIIYSEENIEIIKKYIEIKEDKPQF